MPSTVKQALRSTTGLMYFFPFVDHMRQHLNDHFPSQLMSVMLAWFLTPAKISNITEEQTELLFKV